MTISQEIRQKINKRNSQKGGDYERKVAKMISDYHGLEWKNSFLKTKRTTGGQPHGDLLAIKDMGGIWYASKLGPIECKNRSTEWSFDQVFKNPENCQLIKYWLKSNEDTSSDNSVVFFTKVGVTDYVLHIDDDKYIEPVIKFTARGEHFLIQTAKNFLLSHWPKD